VGADELGPENGDREKEVLMVRCAFGVGDVDALDGIVENILKSSRYARHFWGGIFLAVSVPPRRVAIS
jgi:hypothetical protein